MMSKIHATQSRHGTSSRLNRQLIGMAGSVALAVLLTGNVAAAQLERDDTSTATLVTPKLNPVSFSSQWMRFKLATHAGHTILVYG
jgi:hypothetical protein